VVFLPVSTDVSEDTNDIYREVREPITSRSMKDIEAESFVWCEIKLANDLLPASFNAWSLVIECQAGPSVS